MSRPLRIAYARLNQETNALSVLDTVMDDFRAGAWLDPGEMERACSRWGNEAPGFTRNAELSGFMRAIDAARKQGVEIETIPLFSAWAVPGGPLSRHTVLEFRDMLAQRLSAAGPLDGFYFCMHGAMGARNMEDPESFLLEAVREVVGPDLPIAMTLDLHANLTQRRVDAVDFLVAYHTNPHRDHVAVGQRAGEILVRQITGDARPTTAWRTLPMYLGGGTTIDFLPTMRPLFRWMKQQQKNPKVLDCSLFTCHPWNDSPDLGWSTHITTDGDPALAESLAEELADLAWGVRKVPVPYLPSIEEAIETAKRAGLARRLGAVVFADLSDVVTAGSVGENTRIIRALLAEGSDLKAYVPIRDADAVAALWDKPEGSTATVTIGGKLDPAREPSLDVTARILGKFERAPYGKSITLQMGETIACVTSGPPICMKPAFFRHHGLDPWKADVLVVKNFFPFRLFFAAIARKTVNVRTEGITDFDAVNELEFREPLWPQTDVPAWRPTDRRRRGLAE